MDLGFKLGVVFLVALVISAIATRHHLWILVAGLAMIVAGVVVAAGFVAVALVLGDGAAPAGPDTDGDLVPDVVEEFVGSDRTAVTQHLWSPLAA